jgi:metallo-beta-lactamase family protein
MIRIRPCGAAGEVTGSGYLVETPQSRVLVDFGIFQGGADSHERSRSLGPVEPEHLNAVVLTHAHIDHSGRLPLLVAAGYTGPLYATHATLDLTEILLADMARLETEDLRRTNRRRRRAGEPPIEPLYTPGDVDRLHGRARPLHLGHRQEIARGVRVRLFEAGHILGSASVELRVDDGGRERVLVFSGDVGPCGAPILRDPERPGAADLVVMESTYGGRDRAPAAETVERFKRIVERAARERERVIIPAFAVGRTQVILYYLAEAVREGRLPRDFPIYLDSPMAEKATQAVIDHPELYDEEATELRRRRQVRQDLRGLRITESVADSIALNDSDHPCIIISASGMCEGGRIVHHLRHNLWRANANVLLVGYMAEGTLGRELAEAAPRVEIFGEPVAVRAQIHRLDGFSAHAGHSELLDWLADAAPARPRIVLTHGEDAARAALAEAIAQRYGIEAERPHLEDVITLD